MQFKWTLGTVSLCISGLGMDGLIGEARHSGLTLYNMKRPGRTQMLCSLSFRQARRLKAMAEAREMTVEVVGSWGLPALTLRALARPALILSLAACFILLIFATTRVWEVKVVGTEGAEARQIQDFLAAHGLYFGASSSAVKVNSLEYQTRMEFPQLRFVGIRLAGARATVTVARAMDTGGTVAQPGTNVVAQRAGMVERVTPSQGTPRVKAGDVVAAGQLLIEGVMEYEDGREPRMVAAAGEVIARVWISASATGSLTRVEADPEGAVYQRWTLILGSRQLPISLGRLGDDMVLEAVEAWRLPGFAASAPIALEKRQYRQGRLTTVSYEELVRQLKSQSGAEALRIMPEDAQVLDRSEQIEVDGDTITLTTTLEVLCDIACQDP